MNNSLSFITRTGAQTASVFDDLARLRITVFRDYPYLYEGSALYEKEYLQTYARSARSFIFAVYDGDTMVGATTCLPLEDETSEVREPFEKAGYDIGSLFYFGESILLTPYRGFGLGHRFFDERERHAAGFGTYKTTCFCSVDRGDFHPMRPEGYRPNDVFWQKRGYKKVPSLVSTFDWLDIGESESTAKPMIYWVRDL